MVHEVCLLSFEYPPRISGGLGTFTRKLERELMAKGFRVNVFVPSHNLHLERRTRLVDSFSVGVGKGEEEFQVRLMRGETGARNVYLFSSKKKSSKFNDRRIYYWKGTKTCAFARCFFEYYKRHLSDKKIIIHANDWHSGLAGAVVKAQFPKVPLLYTIHLIHPGKKTGRVIRQDIVRSYKIDALIPSDVMESLRIKRWINLKKSGKIKKKLINDGYWLEPIIANYADRVNTVSRGFLDEVVLPGLKRFRLPRRKFTYVFNGLDAGGITFRDIAGKNAVRKRLLESIGMDDGIMFLNLGRQNTGQKATDVMARAIDSLMRRRPGKMKDARFVILVAEGRKAPKNVLKMLKGLQKKYGKNVRIVDRWIKDIKPYYLAADFFIFPSRFEPFGFTQIEAMCRGAPVIGSMTSGIMDVQVDIYDKKDYAFGKFMKPTGILFRKGSSTSLADSISQMHDLIKNQPGEYRKLQRNSIERAGQFTIDRTADNYASIYRELLAKS